jgi:large subunit ribosomal protein L34e
MVAGKHKSRTMSRKHVRLPGGKTVMRMKTKNVSPATCQITGAPLQGIDRKTRTANKSQKRPTRPFGGVLSAPAMRRVLITKARRS